MFGEYDPDRLQIKPNTIQSYKCYNCKEQISGLVVAQYDCDDGPKIQFLICPKCTHGSVKNSNGVIFPITEFGSNVQGLPEIISTIYNEARMCFSSMSYTACEMLCRKILMNSAVNKGAEENKGFVDYIDYLQIGGYITSPMKKWVDVIRTNGNEATHEIRLSDKLRSQKTLEFVTQMLRILYEITWQYETLEKSVDIPDVTIIDMAESIKINPISVNTQNVEFCGRLITNSDSKDTVQSITNYEKAYFIFTKPNGTKTEVIAKPKNPENLDDTELVYKLNAQEMPLDITGFWEFTLAVLYKDQSYIKSSKTQSFWVT